MTVPAAAGPVSTVAAARLFTAELARHLGWRLPAAAVLSLLLALAEGAGLVLLVPLLQSIGLMADDGMSSRLASAVAKTFALIGLQPTLPAVLFAFLLVSSAHALLYRANVLVQPTLEQRFAVALRERLYRSIVSARWSFFITRRSSDLLHAITGEVDRAGASAHQAMSLFAGVALTSVYMGLAFRMAPVLTILVALAGMGLLAGMRRRTNRSRELGEKYSDANRIQMRTAAESVAGLKVAKTFGAERRDVEVFRRHARARSRTYLDLVAALARSKMWLDIASALLVSGLLFVAVEWFALRGIGLLVLIFVFARVVPRIVALQDSAHVFVAGLPSFIVVKRLTDECEANAEHVEAVDRLALVREVRLERVTFSYSGTTAPVLDDVSFSIPAGTTSAIVGASGAGKSTLADILIGLLRPASGRVVVDGRPLEDRDIAGWRRSIGYVPQDGFLLHDSIRANLRWAVPGATDDAMWIALERAAAAEFVRARPEGLDTVVGDRGVRLSGGERQRLALARALLAAPDLLVLDEATSSLDPVNEQQILDAVRRLTGVVTTVIITHRLAAVRRADQIHVLTQGRIVEAGTWADLASGNGTFAALLEAQHAASVEVNLLPRDV